MFPWINLYKLVKEAKMLNVFSFPNNCIRKKSLFPNVLNQNVLNEFLLNVKKRNNPSQLLLTNCITNTIQTRLLYRKRYKLLNISSETRETLNLSFFVIKKK